VRSNENKKVDFTLLSKDKAAPNTVKGKVFPTIGRESAYLFRGKLLLGSRSIVEKGKQHIQKGNLKLHQGKMGGRALGLVGERGVRSVKEIVPLDKSADERTYHQFLEKDWRWRLERW